MKSRWIATTANGLSSNPCLSGPFFRDWRRRKCLTLILKTLHGMECQPPFLLRNLEKGVGKSPPITPPVNHIQNALLEGS